MFFYEFCNLDVDNIFMHPNYVDTSVLNFLSSGIRAY
jgi:hypothetical protein